MTGDPVLDACLVDADRRFVGSRALRHPYLREIADHLIEARDRAVEAGADPESASVTAVESYGDSEPVAAPQRAERARVFWRSTLFFWIFFGSTKLLFLVLLEFPDPLLMAVRITLPSGLLSGYITAWALGISTPTTGDESDTSRDGSFEVGFSRGLRILASIFIVLVAGALALNLMVFLGIGPLAGEIPHAAALLFVILATPLLTLPISGFIRIRVDDDGFIVSSPLGSRRIGWNEIVAVDMKPNLLRALRPPTGRKVRIRWRTEDGTIRSTSIVVDGSMRNLDRFLAALDQRGRANAH